MKEDNSVNQETNNADASNDRKTHDEHVRDLALILFDHTQSLHELTADSRRVMEMAALYHHFSASPQKKGKKPERAIRKGLRKELGDEISDHDLDVLAVILATHQRKIKRKDYDRLNISPIQQREALTIASLLRIASGLDDSRSQATTIQEIQSESDQIVIIVVGPNAASDAAVAQYNTRLWSKIGYPQTKVLGTADAAEQLLLYPKPGDAIGIAPTDSLTEAGRKVMSQHFARMLVNEDGTRQGEDPEALHDMRVATRRLRVASQVFKDAYETGALKPYRKGLRATGRTLGGVRDLDVFADHIHQYQDSLPEDSRADLSPLRDKVDALRQAKRTKMLAYLDSKEYDTFKRQFNAFLHTPGAGTPQFPVDEPAPKLVLESAPVLIYSRYAAMRAYDPFVADADIDFLHGMRLEFRKLRYTIEFFREVLGGDVEDIIAECKRIQDHLGALGDANVAAQFIEGYLDKTRKDGDEGSRTATKAYLAIRREERDTLHRDFPAAWEDFNSADLRFKLASALASL
jgi:CHAD domain-containing protein